MEYYEVKGELRQFRMDLNKTASKIGADDFNAVLQSSGAQTLVYSDQFLKDLIAIQLFQITLPSFMFNS